MSLATLYKTAKSGATQVITITANIPTADSYEVVWGQLNGKMQTKVTKCSPKNIGKSSQTTAEEQALVEAKAYWDKKQKTNYSTDASAPVIVMLPMKVQTYQKHMKKVQRRCFQSPKLNGINATYKLVDGVLQLKSRGGEDYPMIAHHVEDVKRIMDKLGTNELNGELYIRDKALQDISSAVKKFNHLTPYLKFYIFDLPAVEGGYEDRLEVMRSIDITQHIKVVHAEVTTNDHATLDRMHDDYVAEGFEGLMIRNPDGKYVHNTRSYDVFKFKKTQDAEFRVIGYKLDKNGHAVFECIAQEKYEPAISVEDGITTIKSIHSTFKVKLKGTAEARLVMAAIADSYKGQWLKIEYEMLSNDGIPLKPVGIMFRTVDQYGEASE